MKKVVFLAMFLASQFLRAQDTFINERVANNSNDVIGSAKFVGMGGAMGALGADISTISWNPAGIGLIRKNDVSMTFGGLWGQSSIDEESNGKMIFDQAGIVLSINSDGELFKFVNIGINYQKKADYYYNFYADNHNLKWLSQMDQLAELANFYVSERGIFNLTDLAYHSKDNYLEIDDDNLATNYFRGTEGYYTQHAQGSLQGYEINLSTNSKDRYFFGLTVGIDNLIYKTWSDYLERNTREGTDNVYGDYILSNSSKVSGYGFNVKLGAIIRPIESSSFRLALALETPTWYRLRNRSDFGLRLTDKQYYDVYNALPLQHTITSPWKVRAGMGSTVGNSFAWDVDYEFANYAGMKAGYWEDVPTYDNADNIDTERDPVMTRHSKNNLTGMHTIRAGVEYRPVSSFAMRAGYNYITSPYKKNVSFDQLDLVDSPAMDYTTGTSYMRTGDTNILTLGIGYRRKGFYVDLAYKIRNLSADFYPFDTNFTNYGEMFARDFPELANTKLDPVNVNLTRHSVICTLGYKF